MRKSNRLVSIQEISSRTGLSLSSLNYYVNMGLLSIADRQGNRRLFVESQAIRHLDEISRLRREGYPLRIIRHRLQGNNK